MEEKGKKLGLWNLVGYGLGSCIGTGIFVMMGFGIAHTGRSIIIALILGVAFMMLSNWAYLAMSSMFVFKGGGYGMQTMLLSPLMIGVNAWFTVLGGGITSLALAFTSYLCILVPDFSNHATLVAFIVLTIAFAVTIRGSRFLTLVENLITIILVIALFTFIGFGIGKVDAGSFFSATHDGGFFRNGIGGLVAAVSTMSFACMGQTAPAALAAVSKKPKRNVPLSMLLVALIMSLVYAAMGYVASGILPFDQISGQNISVTAEVIFPTGLFMFFVVGGGLCAIASSTLTTLGGVRYPVLQIAETGWLPAAFKKQTKSGYPYVTYLFYYAISVLPLAIGIDLEAIISLTMIPMMIVQAYLSLACMTLPKKYPEQWAKRTVKFPLIVYRLGSILGALCSCVVIYNLFINLSVMEMILAVVIVALLFGLSLLRMRQGAVKVETILEQRKEIITNAIADDVA